MEKKGEQSASNHSDKDKQKATQAGVSAIPNPDNNQAAADNKTQNKAKVKKANSTKGSKKGVAASNSGGSRTGKAETGGESYSETNKQQVIDGQKGNNKKDKKEQQCFTGDTLICTDKGYRPIKEIRKGDDIYSRNEKTKETGLKKVTNLFKSVANTIHKIWLDGKERIKTTAYHPIFVKGKGWVNAINLQEGNEIETMEGVAQVTRIEKTRHEDPVDVYNVQVEEWESYFVSESQAFVHNCNQGDDEVSQNEKELLEQTLDEYFQDLQERSDYQQTIPERPFEIDDLKKLTPQENAEKRAEFDDLKAKLKRQWEEKNGCKWPTYSQNIYSKNGKLIRKAGGDYDAHHIQPLSLGGENEAGNITPMHAKSHYDWQGIHAPKGPYSRMSKMMKK